MGARLAGREIVARLWLAEGLPVAFKSCPAIYESLRGWLGNRLDIHPKEITLIGSARIGYSMAPAEFGRPFGEQSDLDLAIISTKLFERLNVDFQLFSEDYKAGTISPRNDRERALWKGNLEFGERNVPKGFIDAWKLPNFDRYPVTQQINQAMWKLLKKLETTASAPKIRRASSRVYRNWQSLANRMDVNLVAAIKEFRPVTTTQ